MQETELYKPPAATRVGSRRFFPPNKLPCSAFQKPSPAGIQRCESLSLSVHNPATDRNFGTRALTVLISYAIIWSKERIRAYTQGCARRLSGNGLHKWKKPQRGGFSKQQQLALANRSLRTPARCGKLLRRTRPFRRPARSV